MPQISTSQAPESTRSDSWYAVILFALCAFVLNTTEFMPVGMLADIGQSFGMSSVEVGPIMSAYAAVVALGSLPVLLLFAQFERKNLLLGLLAVFIVGHIISVWAPTYSVLLFGRAIIACAHALFWAITPAMVVRMAPQGKTAQALSLFSVGTVSAFVMGLPLGRLIGQFLGWRLTFAAIGLLAFILMLLLWRGLPRLPAEKAGSWRSLPSLLRNKALMWLFGLTIVLITGHFAVYTYLEPLLQVHFAYPQNLTTLILLLFGGSGLLGSMIFSRYQANHPRSMLLLSQLIFALCIALLPLLGATLYTLLPLCLIWGASMMVIPLSMQSKGLKLAHNATDVAMAIYSALFNVGIGTGALLGNVFALKFGVQYNGPLSAILVILALIPLLMLFRARWAMNNIKTADAE